MDDTSVAQEVEEYLKQGQVLLGAEKFEEAVQSFNKALAQDDHCKDAYISKGIAQAFLEKYDEAEGCFDRALILDKNDHDACYHKGNIAFMRDDLNQGIKYYNLAISNGFTDPNVYFQLGLLYEQSEDIVQALRNYSKAIRLDEINPVYRTKKAVLQLQSGDYDGVLETTAELRRFCPDNFEGYHLGAAAYTMQEKFAEAEAILTDACSRFPEDCDLILDLARVYVSSGELPRARELLKQAQGKLVTDDERKELLLNLGKLYIQEEKNDEAEKALLNSLDVGEAKSGDFEARFILLTMYYAQKKYEKMLELANSIIDSGSREPYALSAWYFAALAKKESNSSDYKDAYVKAIRVYRQYSLQEPARVDAAVYRAMCHRGIGEYDKALECVDYVLLLSPDNRDLHVIRSGILKEMNRPQEAHEEMRKASQLKGSDIPGLFGGE